LARSEAVKSSVQLYLNKVNQGRLLTTKAIDWPEYHFKLIFETGRMPNSKIPDGHFCKENAKLMALTHNTIFRALNALYIQALGITPGTQEAVDIRTYCLLCCFYFIQHHHNLEQTMYFPDLEKASGFPSLMNVNIEEHRKLDEGLENSRKFAEDTKKRDEYSGDELRRILDSFAADFETHMHAEITAILDLHDKIESETLKAIYTRMFDASEHCSDIFQYATPSSPVINLGILN
jgi:hemerythrin-like domain-containing protein